MNKGHSGATLKHTTYRCSTEDPISSNDFIADSPFTSPEYSTCCPDVLWHKSEKNE